MQPEAMGIGLIGLGGISGVHIEGYRKEGLRVVAGADPRSEARKERAAQFGIDVYASGAELAAREDVHVLDITVLHDFALREPLLRELVTFGKPIVIQKPLAVSLEEATALVEIAEAAGVPMMVHHNSIFVPAFKAVFRAINEGKIGTPYFCQIQNRAWLDFRDHAFFGRQPRWVLASMGVHHLALLDHWFGAWRSVHAMMGVDGDQPGVIGDTWSSLHIRYESGMCAHVLNDWSVRDSGSLAHPREELVIQGHRGTILAAGNDVVLRTSEGESRESIEGNWFPDAFGRLMRHYLEALASGGPLVQSGRANLRVISLLEAAYRSAESGELVLAG
jgi:predicted dehydrogenase